jgi:hypothetical protein
VAKLTANGRHGKHGALTHPEHTLNPA